MRTAKRGFTLIELLIVVVIVGILALAAIPLVTNSTRDARRAEGEQMMGAARDFCRAEYAKTGNTSDVATAFGVQAANGAFSGQYYSVASFSASSTVAGMDASVQTNVAADGQGRMDFTWESGTAAFSWP
ncbi:MAG: prepilin-type N-terminal cleavage/methylation domain-containing protein [Planctomycetes bacterium]|nr:prepilin-type N-terminal cleavage/methylation domain-containing protein [Planctomycetota bacterium]